MTVLILDFGSQYSHLIKRRIQELGVLAELKSIEDCTMEAIDHYKAIILSGGPMSVYDPQAVLPPLDLLTMGIPILGICYGHQVIVHLLGGKVEPSKSREYGLTMVRIVNKHPLFEGLEKEEQVWMSHGDIVKRLPNDFFSIANTPTDAFSAIANDEKKIFSVQFHPEVSHTIHGIEILRNFLKIAGLNPSKTKTPILERVHVPKVKGNILLGLSGGVDSAVTASILARKNNDNLFCVFVDTGLLRSYDEEHVKLVVEKTGIKHYFKVDASQRFLKALKGIKDPEQKRKIIGKLFIEVFEEKALELEKKYGKFTYLAQGTIYPDRIESAQASKQAHVIKSHHNVGGLPDRLKLELLEPLKELYKDEVRSLGLELGLPPEVVFRHPFPGPGLAIRIIGEVTEEKLNMVRKADKILIDELHKAKIYYNIWQAYAAYLPVKTVGVMGDQRTYNDMILIRLINSTDGMTADVFPLPKEVAVRISTRIVNEIPGINRVVYDITQKPPATIELE